MRVGPLPSGALPRPSGHRHGARERHSPAGLPAKQSSQRAVIAVDPGREKCGVAVVLENGDPLDRRVVSVDELPAGIGLLITRFGVHRIVLGAGTYSAQVRACLGAVAGVDEIVEIDEAFSTVEARELYWREKPPRGWKRLIPRSLLAPPEPYDELTAWVLGKRFWEQMARQRAHGNIANCK